VKRKEKVVSNKACRTIVVKLGGSLITRKDKPLTPNLFAIRAVSKGVQQALRRDTENQIRLFLVHGGGSFGHYYPKMYHLSSSECANGNSEGVAKTAAAMQEIHSIILKEFVKNGVYCKTADVSEILNFKGNSMSEDGKQTILDYFDEGLTPMSFGNVRVTSKGTTIVSGDTVCLALARSLPVNRVIFAMDIDGIYKNPQLKGRIYRSLKQSDTIISKSRRFDVTGGIERKMECAFEISECGSDVFFLNGLDKTRLARCISGESNVKATKIDAAIPLG